MRLTCSLLYKCQHPLTSFLTACIFVHFHDSLSTNNLTNYGRDMSGIIQLAEALKMNEDLTSLKYVPALSQTPIKQASAPPDVSCWLSLAV